ERVTDDRLQGRGLSIRARDPKRFVQGLGREARAQGHIVIRADDGLNAWMRLKKVHGSGIAALGRPGATQTRDDFEALSIDSRQEPFHALGIVIAGEPLQKAEMD